jgi:hypothetical protein
MLPRLPLQRESTSTTKIIHNVTVWQKSIIFILLVASFDTITPLNGWNQLPSRSTRLVLSSSFCLLFPERSSKSSLMTMVSPLSSSTGADATATTTPSSNNPKPRLPIPEPIYSNIPGTWAYDTMSRRVDEEILQRTYDDNKDMFENNKAFSAIKAKFDALRKDLQTSSNLKMLDDLPKDAAPERKREWQEWKAILQPFLDRRDTWLTAPWMVTEFYLYRRLMDVLGYWDVDSPGYHFDPFSKQKRAGLESSVGSVRLILYFRNAIAKRALCLLTRRIVVSFNRPNPCWPRYQTCPNRQARGSIWQQV